MLKIYSPQISKRVLLTLWPCCTIHHQNLFILYSLTNYSFPPTFSLWQPSFYPFWIQLHFFFFFLYPHCPAFLKFPHISGLSVSKSCLFVTPWTEAHQTSLSLSISWSLPKFMSIASVTPINHFILCCPLSPSAVNLSQHQGLFQWVGCLYQVSQVLEFQLQHLFFQWIFKVDFL